MRDDEDDIDERDVVEGPVWTWYASHLARLEALPDEPPEVKRLKDKCLKEHRELAPLLDPFFKGAN